MGWFTKKKTPHRRSNVETPYRDIREGDVLVRVWMNSPRDGSAVDTSLWRLQPFLVREDDPKTGKPLRLVRSFVPSDEIALAKAWAKACAWISLVDAELVGQLVDAPGVDLNGRH